MGFFPDIKLLVLNVNLSVTTDRSSGRKRLFRRQSSLFLYGATGSGKTTMLERATGKSPEELAFIGRTLGQESHVIETRDKRVNFVVDYGGEQQSFKERIRTLNDIKPLAILLLLDHAPRGKETDPVYRCPKRGILPSDEEHPIRQRFEEHKRAIDELIWVFDTSPALGKQCRLVLPIVNKRDAWESMGYTIHIFTDWYFDALMELTRKLTYSKVKLNKPMPLAGKWEGFGNCLDIVREQAGEELFIRLAENPLFTLIVRIPVAQKA